MSAVPVPALVVAGTSDLPSSVAFIFSAKAGPAKAKVAPSASIVSMVLVFDMVFSLLASSDGASFKTMGFRLYSRNRLEPLRIFRRPMTAKAAIVAVGSILSVTDRGMRRRILRRIVLGLLVLGATALGVFWWLTATPVV